MRMFAIMFVLGAFAAPACKKTVNTEDFEARIRTRVEQLGLPSGEIACPKGVAAKAGTTFVCTVTMGGKPYELESTITQIEGKRLDLTTKWKQGEAIVAAKLASTLGDKLTKLFELPVTIDCGEPLRFLTAERTVTCDLTAGAAKAAAEVTFDDKLAPKSWKIDPDLLIRTKIEAVLTPMVRAKTSPNVTITCGTEPVMPRPTDGKLACEVTDGAQHGTLEVTVNDKLDVEHWEIVANK